MFRTIEMTNTGQQITRSCAPESYFCLQLAWKRYTLLLTRLFLF